MQYRTKNNQLRNKSSAFVAIVIILNVAVLSGCAGLVQPISTQDRTEFEKTNNAVVVHYAPAGAMINWGATGSAIVDWPNDLKAEYIDKGKPVPAYVIMKRHDLPDPILTVTQHFIDGLKSKTGITKLNFVEAALPLPVKDDVTHYKSQYQEPYIIEVGPEANLLGWGFTAQLTSTTTYKFNHVSVAKIIRQSDSKVIWKGRCFVSGQNDDALNVSFDEMVSQNSEKVKSVVNDGLNKCAQKLITQYLTQKQ
jgi:hypothetical protein